MNDSRQIMWPTAKLGAIAEFRNGINYNNENFGTGIQVINVKDFQDHIIAPTDGLDQINPSGVIRQESLLRDNDIIFVRSNGNRELIGRSMLLRNVIGPLTHSAFSIRLRFTTPDVSSRFFAYVFRTNVIRQALSARGQGTNISNLNQGILENLDVPLPPLPTQRKIAAILSAYDDLIENNQRRIRILEDMAQATYDEMSARPGHRAPVNLFEAADVTYGFPFKSSMFSTGSGHPVIRIRDIKPGRTATRTTEIASDKYIVRNGDLIVGMDGDFHIGKWTGGDAYLNQRVVRFRPKRPQSRYLLYLAIKEPIKRLEREIVGTTVAHLSDRDLRAVSIMMTTACAPSAVAATLEQMYDLEVNLHCKNANLRQTRDLLLPKLITGEIDVSELDIANATANGAPS